MNISANEIARLADHVAHLHFQWAEADSRRQAAEAARAAYIACEIYTERAEAAREAYHAAMAEHNYEQPEEDDQGIIDWLKDLRRSGSLYRQCDHCRRWFEIGNQGGGRRVRDDLKFCKPACRSRAYRERKKRAQQLFDSGSSLQTIVKELDSDLETVKGWTNKKRKGGT